MKAEAEFVVLLMDRDVALASRSGVPETPAEPPTVMPTVGAVRVPPPPWVILLTADRSIVPPATAALTARLPPEPRVATLPPPAVMGKPTVKSLVVVKVRLPFVVLAAPVIDRVPVTLRTNVPAAEVAPRLILPF